MKITNNLNLPSAFVNLATDNHPITPGHYSVTTILQPTREILLKRRYYNEIEQDVADMVWMVFGTAVHKVLESADKSGYAEMKLEQEIIDGYVLTGICDLFNEQEHTVEDYKTCSVWKIIHKDFDDWRKQGLAYVWLLMKKGYYVSRLRFHALIKDWSNNDAKFNKDYPKHPIWTWEYEIKVSDLKEIEEFINVKFHDIIINENKGDSELPVCSQRERWNDGNKYAVIKKGQKKAVRVFDNEDEARALATELNANIETRKGEDRKCLNYCLACKFCSYYKEKYGT